MYERSFLKDELAVFADKRKNKSNGSLFLCILNNKVTTTSGNRDFSNF